MAYYRLYSLDLEESHIIDVHPFIADSDSTAILKVRLDDLGIARELWNLGRKVMDFPPRPRPITDRGEPNQLENLVAPNRGWRWNPLEGHCQAVA
ncbi:MAG: hypothetical protein M3Q19_11125 [Pseudomonadota bacterium]|nr:hypothetical protein [Pseudomonadota bacterium]